MRRLNFWEGTLPEAVAASLRLLHQGGAVSLDAPDEPAALLAADVLDLLRGRRAVVDSDQALEAAAKESGADYFSFAQMDQLWARVRPVKDRVTPAELVDYLARRRYDFYVIHGLEEDLREIRAGAVTFSSQAAQMLQRASKRDRAGILYWGHIDLGRLDSGPEPLSLVYDPPLPETPQPGPRSRPSALS